MDKNEYILSKKEYRRALLRYLVTRLPTTIKALRRFLRIDKDGLTWGKLLEEAVRNYPYNTAIKSEEKNLTYDIYNNRVNKIANYFISRGLKRGDTAVVFMENRPGLLEVYSANAKIGTPNSMINTNMREKSLLHALNLNPGKVIIVGEELLDAFLEVRSGLEPVEGQKIFYLKDKRERPAPEGMIDLEEAVKDSPTDNPSTVAEVQPGDAIAYVFTSGTTGGMPKAAVVTHKRVISGAFFTGQVVMALKSSDTMYVPLPFFHTNALALSWPTVLPKGSALAIRRKFSASNFWDDVRKFNATAFCYVGEVCRYLLNQPPKPDDGDNPLRKVLGNGLRPEIWMEFKERFGIEEVYEIYGAAESNLLFINVLNLDCTVGTCFTPFAIVKYDIENDAPVLDEKGLMQRVNPGETGLVLSKITNLSPFAGYTSKEATESKIMRDVFEEGDAWFNCGDLLRDMGFKHAQFVDRLGDTFRWKGENVSTTEVESVANEFVEVAESTVYGVKIPGTEGRAGMASIIARTTEDRFDFKGLAEHFNKHLPHYAVPKFIRFKTELETTATYKAKKFNLVNEGFNPDKAKDPVYVLLPGDVEYKPLTRSIHQEIIDNKYKF